MKNQDLTKKVKSETESAENSFGIYEQYNLDSEMFKNDPEINLILGDINKNQGTTRADIQNRLKIKPSILKMHLNDLVESGFLEVELLPIGKNKVLAYIYYPIWGCEESYLRRTG